MGTNQYRAGDDFYVRIPVGHAILFAEDFAEK
jgi:hypothetical protein